jgi:hypothetical protein
MQEGAFSCPHAFSLLATSRNRAYKNCAAQTTPQLIPAPMVRSSESEIRTSVSRRFVIWENGRGLPQVPELTAVLSTKLANPVVRAGGSKRVPYRPERQI